MSLDKLSSKPLYMVHYVYNFCNIFCRYGLNREEREEIGRKCKYIINWGRLKYLQKLNFDCSLHYYVDKDITLENVCIVAVKNVKS